MTIMNAKEVTINTQLLKVLVVGDYGTGKSVFASTFPTPGFIFDFDKGILTYRGKDWDYTQYDTNAIGWTAFDKEFKEIEKLVKEGKYKTVVIDSTSLMSALAMEKALQLDPKRSPTGGPLWNVHYGMVRHLVEGKLRQFMQWPCNLVVLSHLQVVRDEETGAIIKIQPLLPGALSDTVPGYFDEVYISTSNLKGGVPVFELQTLPRGLYKARSRMSGQEQRLPMYVPNTYSALMKAIEDGSKPKVAGVVLSTKPVVPATLVPPK